MENYDALIEALTIERVFMDSFHPFYGYYCPPRAQGQRSWVYLNKNQHRHRIHGPAYCNPAYGIELWYKNGELHRLNGPADIHGKNKRWYKNGKLHRLDGPAVDTLYGPKEYWIDGQKHSPKHFKQEMKRRERRGLPTKSPLFNA